MTTAIIAITGRGAALARRLGERLPGAEVVLPECQRQADHCRYFAAPVAAELPRLFARYQGLICIMATGIVVRLLAPHLRGKDQDPAVVVMDEAGRFAVSLLSGHLGGANALATQVASLVGAQAVITTATDVNDLPAWDDIARQEGMGVEPLANIRLLNTLLLRGEPIALIDPQRHIAAHFAAVPAVHRYATVDEAAAAEVAGTVCVSCRRLPALAMRDDVLLLRPRRLVVGIGCNRGTGAGEIESAVRSVLDAAGLAFGSVGQLATIDAKADETGLIGFAEHYNLPIDFFSAAELNATSPPSCPSPHALAAVGAKGVCEPAALLASGAANLLLSKQKRGNVTVAVAEKVP